MSIPSIACPLENHYKMPLQYICLSPQCLKNTQELSCIYCCQQLHHEHLQYVNALKMLMVEFQRMLKTGAGEFGAGEMLLKGIGRCRTGRELRQNVGELCAYSFGGERFEKIIDRKNQVQKGETKQFYENRNQDKEEQSLKTVKKNKKQPLQPSTKFITPILTFQAEDAIQQGFQLKSPFCVVNSSQKQKQKLVTAFAYPPINRFNDSIEIDVKIQRITPFWLGVGVSVGKKKYVPQSKQHILLISNGWVSQFGNLKKTQVKYCLKDTVKIKLDKRMQLLEFISNSQKYVCQFQPKWNQDVYLCCVLFYKDDSVQIMA